MVLFYSITSIGCLDTTGDIATIHRKLGFVVITNDQMSLFISFIKVVICGKYKNLNKITKI